MALRLDQARKMSPDLKEFLLRREAAGAAARDREEPLLSVIIRCSDTLAPEHQAALAAAGAQVRSCVGDIATAVLPPDRLEEILDLDFVDAVEGARPMSPE